MQAGCGPVNYPQHSLLSITLDDGNSEKKAPYEFNSLKYSFLCLQCKLHCSSMFKMFLSWSERSLNKQTY